MDTEIIVGAISAMAAVIGGIIVVLGKKPTPSIKSFDTNQNTILLGENFTLRWDVVDANAVSIKPGLGKVALTGEIVLSPTKNTKYTITAKNGYKKSSAATYVHVNVVTSEIRITYPKNNDKLLINDPYTKSRVITITGTISYLPANQYLWIIVQNPNNLYYPFPYEAGIINNSWNATLYQLGNADDGGKIFKLGVYLLDKNAQKEIIEYTNRTRRTNEYGIYSLPDGAKKYDEVLIKGVLK